MELFTKFVDKTLYEISAKDEVIILKRQGRFFKPPRILIIVLVLLSVLGLILYFTYPLKIQNVLQQTENIERIHVTYISNGESTNYLLSKDQGIDFNELI